MNIHLTGWRWPVGGKVMLLFAGLFTLNLQLCAYASVPVYIITINK